MGLVNKSVGLRFGAGVVDNVRGLSIDAAVRSHFVVVAHDLDQGLLKFPEGGRGMFRQELLQGAMPTLDLAARLWMVGTRVLIEDAGRVEIALEAAAPTPRRRVIDRPIEFLSDVKS